MKFAKSRVIGAILLILAAAVLLTGVSAGRADLEGTLVNAAFVHASDERQQLADASAAVTAASDALSRKVERNVCPSSARFAALEQLSAAGVFAGILMLPVLPFIEDTEGNLLAIVKRAADCGARFIYTTMDVTLRANQRQWYYDRLDESFPGLRARYESTYGERYVCPSPRARELTALFTDACDHHGILCRMPDIIAASRAPYTPTQLSLFD